MRVVSRSLRFEGKREEVLETMAAADILSQTTTAENSPSPHLGPSLPPVRDIALAALVGDGPGSEDEATKLVGLAALLQAQQEPQKEDVSWSESALPLQQLLLLHHLQQLHQQTALLQFQKALCTAALTSSSTADSTQLALLHQVAAQHASLLPRAPLAAGSPVCGTAMSEIGAPASLWTRCAPAPTTNAGDRPAALLGEEGPERDKDGGRRRKFHGKQAVACLQEWLYANMKNPYPSLEIKRALARTSGLTESQVDHWFNNARKRLLKARKPKKENLHPCTALQERIKGSLQGPALAAAECAGGEVLKQSSQLFAPMLL